MSIAALIPLLGNIFDKVIPDPTAAADAKLKAMELAQKGELAVLDANMRLLEGQMDINKAEASSIDKYRAGWRPTIGYIAAGALAFQYFLNPLLIWANTLFQWGITPPNIGLDGNLWELIMGMLGLGGLRTYEKLKGK